MTKGMAAPHPLQRLDGPRTRGTGPLRLRFPGTLVLLIALEVRESCRMPVLDAEIEAVPRIGLEHEPVLAPVGERKYRLSRYLDH